MRNKNIALEIQVKLIRHLCRINDTEKLRVVEIHWEWWNRGYDCELFDEGIIDEYRSKNDKNICYFRGWLSRNEDEILKELTGEKR